jgi:hypothetical protein
MFMVSKVWLFYRKMKLSVVCNPTLGTSELSAPDLRILAYALWDICRRGITGHSKPARGNEAQALGW